MLETLVHLLIAVVVIGIVWYVVEYIIVNLPLPEPFRWAAKVIPALIVLILVLYYLVPLVG